MPTASSKRLDGSSAEETEDPEGAAKAAPLFFFSSGMPHNGNWYCADGERRTDDA